MNIKLESILPLGDAALIISWGNIIDESINKKVLDLFHKLKSLSLNGVVDIVPAYCSLTIHYDVFVLQQTKEKNKSVFENTRDEIKKIIEEDDEWMHSKLSLAGGNISQDRPAVGGVSPATNKEEDNDGASLPTGRKIKVPVCYSEKYALDMNEIVQQKKISAEEIIYLHTSKKYRVYMIGFLPGFAYMGEIDEKIAVPRKSQPRLVVEAGCVGIAGKQTGVYPLDSPGGWQIIGKTPLKLFNKEKVDPVLFKPGDEVEFYSISEDEYSNY